MHRLRASETGRYQQAAVRSRARFHSRQVEDAVVKALTDAVGVEDAAEDFADDVQEHVLAAAEEIADGVQELVLRRAKRIQAAAQKDAEHIREHAIEDAGEKSEELTRVAEHVGKQYVTRARHAAETTVERAKRDASVVGKRASIRAKHEQLQIHQERELVEEVHRLMGTVRAARADAKEAFAAEQAAQHRNMILEEKKEHAERLARRVVSEGRRADSAMKKHIAMDMHSMAHALLSEADRLDAQNGAKPGGQADDAGDSVASSAAGEEPERPSDTAEQPATDSDEGEEDASREDPAAEDAGAEGRETRPERSD